TLCEAEPELGGRARLAARVPNRAEFGDLVRNLEGELRRERVEVRTGARVTADQALAGGWDAVVCCTGARPERPAPHVLAAPDVMTGAAVGERVAVVDLVGFHQATSTAEWLAERGHMVSYLTPTLVAGQDLGLTLDLENWHRRVLALGMTITTSVAEELGAPAAAVAAGADPAALAAAGAAHVFVLDVPYDAELHADAVAAYLEAPPRAVLLPGTANGSDLAPRLAARLGAACLL